jgi:hypothetical protein
MAEAIYSWGVAGLLFVSGLLAGLMSRRGQFVE